MIQSVSNLETAIQSWRLATAKDVMTRDVLVVSETMTVEELAQHLVEHEISGAPVVDAMRRPVGVVSLTDLARLAGEGYGEAANLPQDRFSPRWSLTEDELFEGDDGFDHEDLHELSFRGSEGLQVREVMSTPVQTVSEETTVPELAALMASGHFHRLLVVHEGRLTGIVTSMDLLALMAEEGQAAGDAA